MSKGTLGKGTISQNRQWQYWASIHAGDFTPELNVSVCRSGIPWHRTVRKKLGNCASCEAESGDKRSNTQHLSPATCGRQTIRGQWPMAIQ